MLEGLHKKENKRFKKKFKKKSHLEKNLWKHFALKKEDKFKINLDDI